MAPGERADSFRRGRRDLQRLRALFVEDDGWRGDLARAVALYLVTRLGLELFVWLVGQHEFCHGPRCGWRRYYAAEPWGFPVKDYRTGVLASVVMAAAGAKDVKPSDFMLSKREEEDPDPDAVAAKILRDFGS